MKKLFAILGIVSILFLPIIAHADTGRIDVDGDSTPLQWDITPFEGTHFSKIDDGVTAPTAGDVSDYIMTGTNGVQDTFTCTTLEGAGSVTQVIIRTYANWIMGACDETVSIYMGGGWETPQALGITDSNAWYSTTFSGSWTQSDLDGIKIQYTAVVTGAMQYINTYSSYGDVTFTEGGGNGGGSTAPYSMNKKGKKLFFIK